MDAPWPIAYPACNQSSAWRERPAAAGRSHALRLDARAPEDARGRDSVELGINGLHLGEREPDLRGGEVLVHALDLASPGDGDDSGPFLEHPRQGDLAGRGAALRGNAAEELEERIVLLVCLLRELRHAGTVVGRGVETLGCRAPIPRVRVPAMCLSSLWLGLWGVRAATPDTTLCRGRMPRKSPWVGLL